MTSGIYRLNGPKGYYYIGSSNQIERRTTKHFQHLRENKHINKHLQNVYNKYKGFSWTWECIKKAPETRLLKEEQKYLNTHFGTELCLNLVPTANKPPSWKGKKLSDEHKSKISVAKKGWKPNPDTIQNMRRAARKRCNTTPFFLINEKEKLGPFYTFKEVKLTGIMDDSSACELYNNIGGPTRKGYRLKCITT
jgi:group I intron endonuclease